MLSSPCGSSCGATMLSRQGQPRFKSWPDMWNFASFFFVFITSLSVTSCCLFHHIHRRLAKLLYSIFLKRYGDTIVNIVSNQIAYSYLHDLEVTEGTSCYLPHYIHSQQKCFIAFYSALYGDTIGNIVSTQTAYRIFHLPTREVCTGFLEKKLGECGVLHESCEEAKGKTHFGKAIGNVVY